MDPGTMASDATAGPANNDLQSEELSRASGIGEWRRLAVAQAEVAGVRRDALSYRAPVCTGSHGLGIRAGRSSECVRPELPSLVRRARIVGLASSGIRIVDLRSAQVFHIQIRGSSRNV